MDASLEPEPLDRDPFGKDPFGEDSFDAALAAGYARAPIEPSSVCDAIQADHGELPEVRLRRFDSRAAERGVLRIDRFDLLERLEWNGNGELWRARDVDLGRSVAVQLLSGSRDGEERLAAALQHPGVAATYELGRAGEQMFVVRPLDETRTLQDEIENGRDKSELLRTALAAARAIAYAHAAGRCHGAFDANAVQLGQHGEVIVARWSGGTVERDVRALRDLVVGIHDLAGLRDASSAEEVVSSIENYFASLEAEEREARRLAIRSGVERRAVRHRNRVALGFTCALALALLAAFWLAQRAADDERARTRSLQHFDLLAWSVRLDTAHRTRGDLLPPWPDKTTQIRAWIERAERITRALPDIARGIELLEPAAKSSESTRFLRRTLIDLQPRIEALQERGGALTRVRADLAWAEDLQRRSIDQHEDAWRDATAAVRADRRYRGLELTPQLGLVPIGRDPDSGLWEFVHLRSGDVAQTTERPKGKRVSVSEDTGIVFVLLPGGTTWIGCQKTDAKGRHYDTDADSIEGPVREVELAPFFLAKHELTMAQWTRLTGTRPPSTLQPSKTYVGEKVDWTHPVETVSCDRAERALTAHGLELPTEAQWEYACRAGSGTRWSSGATLRTLQGRANLADRSVRGRVSWSKFEVSLVDGHVAHAPVDAREPNAFGLHDMHGNVSEWCRDPYVMYAEKHRAGDGLHLGGDPTRRVVRGGSFRSHAACVRTSFREPLPRGSSTVTTGFRAARRIRGSR